MRRRGIWGGVGWGYETTAGKCDDDEVLEIDLERTMGMFLMTGQGFAFSRRFALGALLLSFCRPRGRRWCLKVIVIGERQGCGRDCNGHRRHRNQMDFTVIAFMST